MKQNIYTITFYFNDEWQFIDFTSNMLANAVLEQTDDILDFTLENKGQLMENIIHSKGNEYCVTFSDNPRFVNVYYADNEEKYKEMAGRNVEMNIPWLLLKVTEMEENNKILYNLIDNV